MGNIQTLLQLRTLWPLEHCLCRLHACCNQLLQPGSEHISRIHADLEVHLQRAGPCAGPRVQHLLSSDHHPCSCELLHRQICVQLRVHVHQQPNSLRDGQICPSCLDNLLRGEHLGPHSQQVLEGYIDSRQLGVYLPRDG